MNLHEVYLAAQIAAKEVIKDGNSKPIDTQVNGESENAVQNKAIYDFVNSSVASNTAYFKGTVNSVAELETIVDATNNDYAFVVNTDIFGNTVYNRYKYNGNEWLFEYALNNSSFTANQWDTINSGVTSADIQNLQDGKVDKIAGKGLSANDFTDAEKEKLSWLKNYDDGKVKADIAEVSSRVALNHSTLGYQRKNLLMNNCANKTLTGVSAVVNSDGSITFSGTNTGSTTIIYWNMQTGTVATNAQNQYIGNKKFLPNGRYILSGGKTGLQLQIRYSMDNASDNSLAYTLGENEVEFTITDDHKYVWCRVLMSANATFSNVTIRPMIRPAEIEDNTYESYHPSVQEQIDSLTNNVDTEIKAEIAEVASQAAINRSTLGYQRKNFLPNTATTRTANGVTFTVNADGSVTVSATAAIETATLKLNENLRLPKGRYILSGGVSNATEVRLFINGQAVHNNQMFLIESETDIISAVYIYVYKNASIGSFTHYPMIRLAEITDDTYEPYKPSVEERLAAVENPSAISISLTNTLKYPFNNSEQTVSISGMQTSDYWIAPEIISSSGGEVGRIVIKDKTINNFKIAFTGSATSVQLKLHVSGGQNG